MSLAPASGPSGAAASTASPDSQRKIAARPKQAYLQLRPSTRQTVVKTITTTTIHYAPIPIDRPPSPELGSSHELDRAKYPLELSRKGRVAGLHYGEGGERWNGELHLSLEDGRGGRARPAIYHSNAPELGSRNTGEQPNAGSQQGDRKGKRRAREEDNDGEEATGSGDERAARGASRNRKAGEPATMQPGPSKRRRLSTTLHPSGIPSPATEASESQESQKRLDPESARATSASQWDETERAIHASKAMRDHSETSRDRLSVTSQAGLPSPAISPKLAGNSRSAELETLSRSGVQCTTTVSEEEIVGETEEAGFLAEHTGKGEQQLALGNADATLPTLLSLNSLVSTFATLKPDLQMHVLYNLMRHAPVPVIQSVNHLIQPALKRDFISDLPTELATQVLHHLDIGDIMTCLSVSKNWKRFIDAQGELWSRLIKEDDLWVGDPKDTEGRECETLLRAGTRNKRTGVELSMHELLNLQDSDAALFCQRWKYGFWNHHYDAVEAARPTAWKIEQAQQMAAARENQEQAGSSTESGQTAIGSEQANRLRKTTTLPHIRNQYKIDQRKVAQPTSGPSDKPDGYIHPLKLVYKRRLTVRKHWYRQRPPNRITVTAQHSSIVTAVQFDNDKLITASDDHAIDVYDTRSGRLRMRLRGHDGGIWALQYVGNILVSGSTDRSTRVWDLDTGLCTHVFHGHTSTVRCLKIVQPVNVNPDPNGPPVWEPPYPLIVTGARDNTVRIWKLPQHNSARSSHQAYAPPSPSDESIDPNANPHHIACLRGHTAAIRALAAEGRVIVSGSYDCHLRVWDTLTGKCQYLLQGHRSKVYSVVLDVERKRCASGSMDGSVRLWSLETGAPLHRLDGHSSLVGLLQLSYHFLVSAGADSTLKLWDPATGTCINTLAAQAGAITCFEHDDFRVVSGTEGQIRLWDIRKGQPIRDLVTDMAGVWQVAYSDRYTVAAVQRDGTTEYEILDFFPELRNEEQDSALSPTLTPDMEIGHPGLAEHGSPPGHSYPYGDMSFETPVQTSKLPAMHHHGHHLNRPPGHSLTEGPSTPVGAGNTSQAALPWHFLEQPSAHAEE